VEAVFAETCECVFEGRQFYVCPKVGDGRCTFFLWADQPNPADENSASAGNTARSRSESW
jgi:hypothetical protein